MKKFFAIAAALLISVASFAQETNKDENGNTKFGGYETNKFFDNWYVGLAGGVNSTWDIAKGGFEFAGLATQIDLGKWISPEYGFRFGWRGLNNKVDGNKEAFNFFKADALLHFSNLVAGYKECRIWDVIPFAGVGVLKDEAAGAEWGVEAGIINNFRLCDNFDINLEIGANLAPGIRYSANFGKFVTFPYATLGVAYKFNRADWTRVSTTAAAAAAAIAAANAAKDAAEAKVAGAQKAADDANAAAKKAEDEAKQLVDEAKKAAKANVDGLFDEPVIVYFQIGKSTLTKTEKAHAEYAIKNIIARGNNVKFTLGGSADTKTGSAKRNKQLTEERAKTVYALIDELGVSRENITVVEWNGKDRFATPELNRAVIIEKQ